jgi:hypothetical protein
MEGEGQITEKISKTESRKMMASTGTRYHEGTHDKSGERIAGALQTCKTVTGIPLLL